MEKPKVEGLVRLKNFYAVIRFFVFTAVLIVGGLFVYKIEFFPFIIYPNLFLALLTGLIIFSIIFYFLIAPRTTKTKILYINNVVWAIFIAGALYTTGGTWSPWSILLLFPIITTAFDLEATAAVAIGLVTIGLLALLTLSAADGPPGSVSLGLFLIAYVGLYTFYIYRIIKETLRQKYEKEQTKRKYGELLEIDKAKTDFITVTSHQLRTPLTETRWALDSIAKKAEIPEEMRSIVERGRQSVERLISIVNEMLKVPVLEHPETELKKERILLHELLKEIAEEFRGLAQQKRVSLSLSTEKIEVAADREKIKVAIENIVDNAIRYSPGKTVSVSASRDNESAIIVVRDSGIGISPENQDRLFTKFFRGKNAVLLEPNESGIGLFIAKTIVEKHFGSIQFSSVLGQGTTFTITLPAHTFLQHHS